MRQGQRGVLAAAWPWLALVALAASVPVLQVLRGPRGEPPPVLAELPPFSLVNQAGQPFGSRDLRGRIWVADFVFLGCSDVCPLLTGRMKGLQDRLGPLGDRVHLVTISVDPENDTPERLAAYAQRYGADPRRWTFLTGPAAEVERTVVNGFKVAMGKEPVGGEDAKGDPRSEIFQIFHGEKFVVVDGEGRIRGYFDSQGEELGRLVDVVQRLARASRP